MHVRRASPEDAQDIQVLYRSLVPGDENIQVDPKRLGDLQGHPTNYLFVAESEGAVCGTAFLTVCLDPMYGFQPYGVVENIIVSSSARRVGAGRALMTAVEREARAGGCTKLMLLSSTSRVEGHAFFVSMGFDAGKKLGFIKYLNRTPPLADAGRR